MYKIIVLNETGSESYSREYNSFMSALCLARMGHEVMYIGNPRFAGEFYQGGHTGDVDIFDLEIPPTPAMLPVGFEIFPVPKMNIELINDQRLRNAIMQFGKTDLVFYSGNEYMATFANQIAESKVAVTSSLDWLNEPPCINEIQLRHTAEVTHPPAKRIVSIGEYMWYDEEIERIREICREMGSYELWIVAQSPEGLDHEELQKEGIYWQPPLSDSGRFKLLRSASVYIEPNVHSNPQGIAEALCVGTPVIAQNSKRTQNLFGSYVITFYPVAKPDASWFDVWRKDCFPVRFIKEMARKYFGFAERIGFLHKIIKDLEC